MERERMKKIVLFDMDGTLTPPRKELDRDLIPALRELAKVSDIGILTGSDHNYVLQQMGLLMENSEIRYKLHILPCNGTKYYPPPKSATHKHELAFEKNMREELGELYFTSIMEYVLRRQSQLHLYNLPLTGHFVDYRGSMINWCPIGRNANDSDRKRFQEFDKHDSGFRKDEIKGFINFLNRSDISHKIDIKLGGETSYDIYPKGWDKTFALQHFENYQCWFVGDRCGNGGNDQTIYEKLRVNGRSFEVKTTRNTLHLIFDEIIPRIVNDR
jgi:phosphomannomutase